MSWLIHLMDCVYLCFSDELLAICLPVHIFYNNLLESKLVKRLYIACFINISKELKATNCFSVSAVYLG